MPDRIKTKACAEITDSDSRRYTVKVKVTEVDTDKPVPKGVVAVTAKKGRVVGKAEVSEDGIAEISAAITKKDYKLKIKYEGNITYSECVTKINFKSEYLFYKTSAYLWVSIAIALIAMAYTTLLNTYLLSSTSTVISTIAESMPYFNASVGLALSSLFEANIYYINVLFKVLIWVFIISFIIAGAYASRFNANLYNIIRKNVTNHSMFQNFFVIVILILILITVFEVLLVYIM